MSDAQVEMICATVVIVAFVAGAAFCFWMASKD